MGMCGSDPVRILEGEKNLSAMRSAERRTLERLGLGAGCRMACVSGVQGSVVVDPQPMLEGPAASGEPSSSPVAADRPRTIGCIVVVGAGVAGVTAIEELRRALPDAELTLIGDESYAFYNRMGITRLVCESVSIESLYLNRRDWADSRRVDYRRGVRRRLARTRTHAVLQGASVIHPCTSATSSGHIRVPGRPRARARTGRRAVRPARAPRGTRRIPGSRGGPTAASRSGLYLSGGALQPALLLAVLFARRHSLEGGPDAHVSCPVGRRMRVRMRVRTCLHDLPLVAVRYSVDSWSLQAVSAENSLFPRFRADFNPKVAGSNPARPIENFPGNRSFSIRGEERRIEVQRAHRPDVDHIAVRALDSGRPLGVRNEQARVSLRSEPSAARSDSCE
jgi:Pyridine nucleotide-disulphide oxidoreductase